MTNKTELLPCPFCGGAADFEEIPVGYQPMCADCGVQLRNGSVGVGWYATREDAAADWNRRAAPAEDVRAVVDEPVCYTTFGMIGIAEAMKSEGGTGRVGARLNSDARFCVPLYRHAQRETAKAVLPKRLPDHHYQANGWNACLDEFTRLNPQ